MIKQKIKIKPLSVNKLWRGRRFKTSFYKDYEIELMYSLKKRKKIEGKLKLNIVFGVKNRNSDLDNLLKACTDILQKKYGFNDNKIYEINCKKVITKDEFIDFELIGFDK